MNKLNLTPNALRVLENRYLKKNEQGKVIETPHEMFRRVAHAVASAELLYDGRNLEQIEQEFFNIMANLEFLPNSPTLMNAGTDIGQLSACFVLPVGDSMEQIFGAVKAMAIIHQSGGGTGFSFSNLRPKGDVVKSTGGVASGPVSFMRVFDTATEVIKQGGRRRGANMGILRVDHPDILEFIQAKEKEELLENFNLSVAVTDKFIETVAKDSEYFLVNPRTYKKVAKLNANRVFDLIVKNAWKTGDPGVIFIDEINRHNPTPEVGKIESTNPCGEQPLLPYESCNLGSINLSKMVMNKQIDWEKLRQIVKKAIHFLDNVIDVNKYPLPEIEKITKSNRKIGLGVMGFAEMLIQLGIPYDSDEALLIGERLMNFITTEAKKKSVELGSKRGSFSNFDKSVWKGKGYKSMRSATVTTVAPTGSIGIIADASSGIEPLFAVAFVRQIMGGLVEVNKFFEDIAKQKKFYTKELMDEIVDKGTIRDIEYIPEGIRRLFATALDISPEMHVRIQAAFQKYTENAVSKTVNLPNSATPVDIKNVYLLAYELKCKGITVYRYGSKKEQVLYTNVEVSSDYSRGCRICSV